MFAALKTKPSFLHYFLLVIAAFALRYLCFYSYVQHEERYCQADSPDYYICSLCLKYGHGMYRPDQKKPIFWRTPGYPWFLHFFYKQWGSASSDFKHNERAHKNALLLQIFLCSFLPLLAFWLSYILIPDYCIAWLVAFISVIHPGFILASTFLLTDALAMLFFVLFLIFFYNSFSIWFEPDKKIKCSYFLLFLAAAMLALYTWMRPMGQFVAAIAALLLLFSKNTWQQKIGKSSFFLVIFFSLLAPWFVRNYQWTGKFFFCPLFGLYFNVFNAPKILARAENISLLDAHTKLTQAAGYETVKEIQTYQQQKSPYVVCGEMVCLKTAWPLMQAHPWYFLWDWCVEVCKTTFDLYSYQLVALANNIFKWDPLVEYLPEKIAATLYAQPLSLGFRIIAWLEFLWMIFMWTGIFGGIFLFLIKPLCQQYHAKEHLFFSGLWLKAGVLIGAVVFQTGGFGYARLRLPIELLLIILAVSFWFYVKKKNYLLNFKQDLAKVLMTNF
jgi:hypothetical protein